MPIVLRVHLLCFLKVGRLKFIRIRSILLAHKLKAGKIILYYQARSGVHAIVIEGKTMVSITKTLIIS